MTWPFRAAAPTPRCSRELCRLRFRAGVSVVSSWVLQDMLSTLGFRPDVSVPPAARRGPGATEGAVHSIHLPTCREPRRSQTCSQLMVSRSPLQPILCPANSRRGSGPVSLALPHGNLTSFPDALLPSAPHLTSFPNQPPSIPVGGTLPVFCLPYHLSGPRCLCLGPIYCNRPLVHFLRCNRPPSVAVQCGLKGMWP